jgi:hypothetical protein
MNLNNMMPKVYTLQLYDFISNSWFVTWKVISQWEAMILNEKCKNKYKNV